MEIDFDAPTKPQLAAAFGCSVRWIGELRSLGKMPGDGSNLAANIEAWTAIKSGANESGAISLEQQRARLTLAQAEAAERKNKVEAGELLPLADIELAITSLITISKARLRRVPARIAMGDELLRQRAENAISDALDELSRERAMEEAVGGFDDGDGDSND